MNNDYGFLFQIIGRQIFRYFSNTGKKLGISSMEVNILNYFFDNKKQQIYQKDLETAFNIRSSTATANINLMEKKGLLRRVSDPHDMRRKLLVPTAKAQKFEQQLATYKEELENKIVTNLTENEKEQLKKTLIKVIANLQ